MIVRALPAMSPTIGLICAIAIRMDWIVAFLPLPVLRERVGVRVLLRLPDRAASRQNPHPALSRSTGRGEYNRRVRGTSASLRPSRRCRIARLGARERDDAGDAADVTGHIGGDCAARRCALGR